MHPMLAKLLQNPQLLAIEEVPVEAIPALLVHLGALQKALAARLLTALTTVSGTDSSAGDMLLDGGDAAQQLGTSEDWLYRHAKRLPFTVRLGPRQLRFSQRGIERFIRQRQGRLMLTCFGLIYNLSHLVSSSKV